jgi:hypothetical protein
MGKVTVKGRHDTNAASPAAGTDKLKIRNEPIAIYQLVHGEMLIFQLYQTVGPCRLHRRILPSVGMREVFYLLFHLLTTLARLIGPGGSRTVIAENLLLKQQLIIHSRSRQRAPNLSTQDHANIFCNGVDAVSHAGSTDKSA